MGEDGESPGIAWDVRVSESESSTTGCGLWFTPG